LLSGNEGVSPTVAFESARVEHARARVSLLRRSRPSSQRDLSATHSFWPQCLSAFVGPTVERRPCTDLELHNRERRYGEECRPWQKETPASLPKSGRGRAWGAQRGTAVKKTGNRRSWPGDPHFLMQREKVLTGNLVSSRGLSVPIRGGVTFFFRRIEVLKRGKAGIRTLIPPARKKGNS